MVEDDQCPRRRRGETAQVVGASDFPGRIVRRYEGNDRGLVVHALEHLGERVRTRRPRHLHDACAAQRRILIEHLEARLGDQHRGAGWQKRPATPIDHFVSPGGNEYLRRFDAEVTGKHRLEWPRIRIASKEFSPAVAQCLYCSLERSWRTLVGVEPKFYTVWYARAFVGE